MRWAVELITNLAIYTFLQYILITYLKTDYVVTENDYLAVSALKATGHESINTVEGVEHLGTFIAFTYCEFISLLVILAFICDAILKKIFVARTGQQCLRHSLMSRA